MLQGYWIFAAPKRVMLVFDNDERVVNAMYDAGYTALLVKKGKSSEQGPDR